jgi:hypothetical protein
MIDAAKIVYPYESAEVFRDESFHTFPIQRQASIYNRCQHLSSETTIVSA